MATFDFVGPDVTGTGGNYGVRSNLDPSHPSTNPSTFTEQGVSFTFTSDHESVIGASDFSLNHYHYPSSVPAPPDATGTATLLIVDTDPGQSFLSDISFQVDQYTNFGGNTISILFSNTATGGTSRFTFTGTNLADQTFTLANTGNFNSVQFTASQGFIVLNSITGTPNCFCAGTRIATETGTKPVESLEPGDLVRTADGRLTPVTWLGMQQIDARLMHPAKVNPVCITAGALGGGLPERDLYLSADHAIEIDGTLYNAGALVNGETIHQMRQMPREGFTYYHVETEAHELLLAEGVAAESFIDYAGRDSFANAGEAERRVIAEMALPRVSSARLVPTALRARLGMVTGPADKAA